MVGCRLREIESWEIQEMEILLRSTLSHARGIRFDGCGLYDKVLYIHAKASLIPKQK